MKAGKTGVTTGTPKNIVFGAGTIHKGLRYSATPIYIKTADTYIHPGKTYYTRTGTDPAYTYSSVATPNASALSNYYELEGNWNFTESLIGATQGGSKISIVPEVHRIEADGALVAVKELDVKVGEKATMELNMLELTKDNVKAALLATAGTSGDSNYDLLESKPNIEAGDYYSNIAFVGQTLDGRNIIVIMDNALCTSGFETEGKNKTEGVCKFTFECYSDLESDLDKLPWHFYYPKPASA